MIANRGKTLFICLLFYSLPRQCDMWLYKVTWVGTTDDWVTSLVSPLELNSPSYRMLSYEGRLLVRIVPTHTQTHTQETCMNVSLTRQQNFLSSMNFSGFYFQFSNLEAFDTSVYWHEVLLNKLVLSKKTKVFPFQVFGLFWVVCLTKGVSLFTVSFFFFTRFVLAFGHLQDWGNLG